MNPTALTLFSHVLWILQLAIPLLWARPIAYFLRQQDGKRPSFGRMCWALYGANLGALSGSLLCLLILGLAFGVKPGAVSPAIIAVPFLMLCPLLFRSIVRLPDGRRILYRQSFFVFFVPLTWVLIGVINAVIFVSTHDFPK
jgi:hypothetical protein